MAPPPRLPGELDPGGLEHVLVAVAPDGMKPPVLEPDEPVERALSDHVDHLELPAEGARGRVLLALDGAGHVGNVAHQVQHTDGALGAAQPEHHLVARALAKGLDGHLAGMEQVRHGLGHRHAEEVPRGRVDVVEMPAPGRPDPELGVFPERARDAPASLDERRARGTELGKADARAREPQFPELGELLPVHTVGRFPTMPPAPVVLVPTRRREVDPVYPRSASTLSRAPFTRSRSRSCLTSMVSVDSTSSRSRASALRMTSERAQSRLSETDGALRSSRVRIRCTAVTTVRARRSEISGTFNRMIASSSSGGGKSMNRCRHRRLSPSDSSRALFDVSTTRGTFVALIVPNSGTDTWKSDSTSSRNASNSGSALSISSTSSTTGCSAWIADRSGRGERNRYEKNASSWPAILATASGSDGASAMSSPMRSRRS